jgi:Asp-tRNA(Asn)/Glu-tRNA(Gln) amidotransferase A subunit family amidase
VEANLDCFIDEVRVRLDHCRRVSAASPEEQAADHDARRAYGEAFRHVVGPGDCVVVPVLHDRPPRREASDAELVEFRAACVRLTAPSSLTGSPQVTLPARHDRSGNSYGVGLIGVPGADQMLLEAAIRARVSAGPVEL